MEAREEGFQIGWDEGFESGLECNQEELEEAAEALGDKYEVMLRDLYEWVDKESPEEVEDEE